MTATSKHKLSLKLLIDPTANRVVFAEAGKETIDFLFSLLTLPIGTVVKLLSKQGMLGCLANLYQSVENLNDEYLLQPRQNKDILLKPNTTAQDIPLFLVTKKRKLPSEFYVCNYSSSYDEGYEYNYEDDDYRFHHYVTKNPQTGCPECASLMNKEVELVGGMEEETVVDNGGFVKGVVKYMVMDDLVVKPICTISSISLLKKFNVKDVNKIQEKVVELNMDKGLKLLKTSFQSKEVLTSVFLRSQEDPIIIKKESFQSKEVLTSRRPPQKEPIIIKDE